MAAGGEMSQVAYSDPSKLPTVAVNVKPEDKCLEAFCPRCRDVVDAVCPACRGNVDPGGAVHGGVASRSAFETPEFYRRFVTLLETSRNTKFTLVCFLLATGDAYADGVTMEEVAKEWKVCKATVSKQCVFICKYLGIPPSPYMRKEAAAEKFRQSNRRPVKHE